MLLWLSVQIDGTFVCCIILVLPACHQSCKDGCEGPESKQCYDCADGWELDEAGCLGMQTNYIFTWLWHWCFFVVVFFLGGGGGGGGGGCTFRGGGRVCIPTGIYVPTQEPVFRPHTNSPWVVLIH